MEPQTKPIFGQFDDNPADLLSNAAAVTCFLSETAQGMSGDLVDHGLSDGGVFGFIQILNTLENTINEAAVKL